jgi:two-component system sensor histidine kinase GlrK
MRLSIFWRLALGSLAIIVLIAGVNLYALVQLRQLTALSTELVAYHTPAVETAKRLITSLYAQLRSEKKYLAVHDPIFLKDFREEAEEFRRTRAVLYDRETSAEGRRLLEELDQLHEHYRTRFAGEPAERKGDRPAPAVESAQAGDDLIARMIDEVEIYVDLHEARVNAVLSESRDRSGRAETITQQLVLVAILLGLGLAGIASYSILWPLRRIQDHIRQIGQGQFGTTVNVDAPSDLRELVDTVNWMGKKLQELDDMKTEFLAHISHELRTPLASIREGTQLLLDEIPGTVSQPQRETLQIMKESSHRLIHLISTLLDLSKMEAGLMEYRIVPHDLARVVDTSVNKLRLLAEGKRIQIVTDVPHDLMMVPIDAPRIEQVLDNLLSNALKFSPELTAVTVRVEPDQKGGWMRLSVSDMGPGIPAEDLPHVFERFYQGRVQARNAIAGTGLGLALAKRVVEAHGGQIWVESEVGKGTVVRLILPLRKGKGT